MKIKCDLIVHSKVVHINQILSGFIELNKKGLIDLKIINKLDSVGEWAEVILNDKVRVIYDTYDSGYIFAPNINFDDIDHYFKRSYVPDVTSKISNKIKPLGLNYDVLNKNNNTYGFKIRSKKLIKSIIKNTKTTFYINDFECYPNILKSSKVCFLTRMWDTDPRKSRNDNLRKERIEINQFRAACIRNLRSNFGNDFIGGVVYSEFSKKEFTDCIVADKKITYKGNFINMLKTDVDVCIATTGLNGSIGWKFGEYVAASRAIISEKLNFELPGNFEEGKNYLEFSSVDELISNVNKLFVDNNLRLDIMKNNYRYYNSYVRPDSLIMNTLLNCEEIF